MTPEPKCPVSLEACHYLTLKGPETLRELVRGIEALGGEVKAHHAQWAALAEQLKREHKEKLHDEDKDYGEHQEIFTRMSEQEKGLSFFRGMAVAWGMVGAAIVSAAIVSNLRCP